MDHYVDIHQGVEIKVNPNIGQPEVFYVLFRVQNNGPSNPKV